MDPLGQPLDGKGPLQAGPPVLDVVAVRAAGVPVDLEIYRGVTHDFIKMGRAIPEARQAHADAAAALRGGFQLE